MEMSWEKTKDTLKLNAFWIVVAAVCCVYMARGFVTIVETGKTVGEILADGALSACFGFLISKLLSLQGLAKGEMNEQVRMTKALHGSTVESVSKHIDKLDEWCALKNEEARRSMQIKLLAAAGVSYSEWVAGSYTVRENGVVKQVDAGALPRDKRRAVRRATRLRLTPLTAGSLTSDGSKGEDPYNFGTDKRGYERRRDLRQWMNKLVCGLAFGYFGVQLIDGFSWASLVWAAVQVAVFLSMGMIAYLQAYFFVVDVDRHRVIRKIDNLQKFAVWSEQARVDHALDHTVAVADDLTDERLPKDGGGEPNERK